jgi:hypothetical protein
MKVELVSGPRALPLTVSRRPFVLGRKVAAPADDYDAGPPMVEKSLTRLNHWAIRHMSPFACESESPLSQLASHDVGYFEVVARAP